ncbi:TPA: DNA-3-methyladenine glycosylase 2 [Klebsiella aerogenes]|uniref:DNA-3-methyladenine glycosylase 2 n=1 Tax=Klebsiella TaxID=570 RepID=UPI00063C9DB2|nr:MULTISPECIES: DNA-3-methyladenine glycosylase 2 [Klebsiella]KLF15482.1 3-methyladenine DNA glycosylase [Klebsiella aerogenes]MDU9355599.1 DNA-3-methyladenine glycosylase 2 [Klebsiella sp. 141153]MDY0849073.1 DNA-3-methyladenine glycosylase 2 [Klebsiella aerogenes]WPS34719.1 DNA-3-methyladenine glycosylase 2 [Klebsiella aerogenes]HBV6390049.1 DNA-3-methyladenine glycosylase 2 [Klebsiella aerogenes]
MTLLPWQPPYDWRWMFAFLSARAVAGIESFHEDEYTRSFSIDGHSGLITVKADECGQGFRVMLSRGLLPVVDQCLARVAQLFDLACDPFEVTQTLGKLAQPRPGLRLPGALDAFEQAVRAVLGQLVSVAMAAKLTAKVAAAYGQPLSEAPGYVLFPDPQKLAQADPLALKALGMPLRRAEALIHLGKAALSGELPLTAPADIATGMKQLQSLPGIGRWTANYYALRGWQAKDIFLPDDYLIKQRFPGMTPARIARYASRWQPWRSYALLHIWYTEGWTPDEE